MKETEILRGLHKAKKTPVPGFKCGTAKVSHYADGAAYVDRRQVPAADPKWTQQMATNDQNREVEAANARLRAANAGEGVDRTAAPASVSMNMSAPVSMSPAAVAVSPAAAAPPTTVGGVQNTMQKRNSSLREAAGYANGTAYVGGGESRQWPAQDPAWMTQAGPNGVNDSNRRVREANDRAATLDAELGPGRAPAPAPAPAAMPMIPPTVTPAAAAPAGMAPLESVQNRNNELRKAASYNDGTEFAGEEMYAKGTTAVKGPAGVDKVPAMLTRGEAVLPVKTAEAVGRKNIARLIAETNGKPPAGGLRRGGKYEDGLIPRGRDSIDKAYSKVAVDETTAARAADRAAKPANFPQELLKGNVPAPVEPVAAAAPRTVPTAAPVVSTDTSIANALQSRNAAPPTFDPAARMDAGEFKAGQRSLQSAARTAAAADPAKPMPFKVKVPDNVGTPTNTFDARPAAPATTSIPPAQAQGPAGRASAGPSTLAPPTTNINATPTALEPNGMRYQPPAPPAAQAGLELVPKQGAPSAVPGAPTIVDGTMADARTTNPQRVPTAQETELAKGRARIAQFNAAQEAHAAGQPARTAQTMLMNDAKAGLTVPRPESAAAFNKAVGAQPAVAPQPVAPQVAPQAAVQPPLQNAQTTQMPGRQPMPVGPTSPLPPAGAVPPPEAPPMQNAQTTQKGMYESMKERAANSKLNPMNWGQGAAAGGAPPNVPPNAPTGAAGGAPPGVPPGTPPNNGVRSLGELWAEAKPGVKRVLPFLAPAINAYSATQQKNVYDKAGHAAAAVEQLIPGIGGVAQAADVVGGVAGLASGKDLSLGHGNSVAMRAIDQAGTANDATVLGGLRKYFNEATGGLLPKNTIGNDIERANPEAPKPAAAPAAAPATATPTAAAAPAAAAKPAELKVTQGTPTSEVVGGAPAKTGKPASAEWTGEDDSRSIGPMGNTKTRYVTNEKGEAVVNDQYIPSGSGRTLRVQGATGSYAEQPAAAAKSPREAAWDAAVAAFPDRKVARIAHGGHDFNWNAIGN